MIVFDKYKQFLSDRRNLMPKKNEESPKSTTIMKYLSFLIAFLLTVLYSLVFGIEFIDFSNVQEVISSKFVPMMMKILLILFVAALTLEVTKPVVNKLFSKATKKLEDVERAEKGWSYFIWFFALLIIILDISGNIAALGISLGIFGAGLAFAMQQPLMCLVGWFFVITRRPYGIGDRILIGDIKGDVVDVRMIYTILRESGGDDGIEEPTGRLVTLPNSTILQKPIVNYTSDNPYIFEEIANAVTYESDHELAKNLMIEAAKEVVGEDMKKAYTKILRQFRRSHLEHYVFSEPQIRVAFGESFLDMRVRFICDARKRRKIKSEIVWKILKKFNAPENKDRVEIAYPHTELILHQKLENMILGETLDRY